MFLVLFFLSNLSRRKVNESLIFANRVGKLGDRQRQRERETGEKNISL